MTRLIAFMTTPGGLTGAPRRLLTLADALRERGVDVCIASQSNSELLQAAQARGHARAAMDVTGVLALRHGALFGGGLGFRLRVLLALLRQQWRVLRCIRRNRADVVWIRGSKGIAFTALGAVLSGRPLIWDVDYELLSRGVVRWLHRFGLWAASAVVFQYRSAAEEIFGKELAGRYKWKFRTIIPGIDFSPLEAVTGSFFGHASGRSDPAFTIIQVGTVCDRKNQDLTIEALGRLHKARLAQPLRLLLVGGVFDENYAAALRAKVAQLGLDEVVEFLGWRNDVHRLIACSDLMLMPSRDEGVPNAVQEAMYLGVPVIASPAGGMPEIIEQAETGWVLPLSDAGVWTRQIEECLEKPSLLQRVGRNASEYARTHFSVEIWGRQYAELLREAVSPG
jgi:glycosyltransferase involved in cell wall biosynthesis